MAKVFFNDGSEKAAQYQGWRWLIKMRGGIQAEAKFRFLM